MVIEDPETKEDGLALLSPRGEDNVESLEASEAITAGNVVSLKADGTIELARANNTHWGRVYGIILGDVAAGDSALVLRYGEYYNENFSFANGPVYILNIYGESYNLSQTLLQYKTASQDMVIEAAKAIDSHTILFDHRNQPLQIILEVEQE